MNDNAHRALRESLGAYALDQLDERERLTLDAHLAGCPACRAELDELTPVVESLRLVDVARLGDLSPAPPPELGETVAARVRAEAGRRRAFPRNAVAAAAAVVVLAAGAAVGWLAHPDVPASPEIPLETVEVDGTDPGIVAAAQLVPHTWGVEIRLTASGFDPGQAYRVAITDAEGRRMSAGEFIGTGAAEMTCNLNSSVLRAQAQGFEITDPAGAPVLTSTF
ncbi:anti-sigma factor family protein [Amycolatopsis antarctica]|uniref:anti-sigma factor family protein n=1 Tax=Amycolatopsis antarctica TaxID=1854586 RepID=UPI001F0A6790|nr:zf-HC2 domain-containing protein [Amycolatopsis antarctica]